MTPERFEVRRGRVYLIVLRPSADFDVALQLTTDVDILSRDPAPYPEAINLDCGLLAQANEAGTGEPEAVVFTAAADHEVSVHAVGVHDGLAEFFVIEAESPATACDIASDRDVLVMGGGRAPACQVGPNAPLPSTPPSSTKATPTSVRAATQSSDVPSAGPEALMAEWERSEATCQGPSTDRTSWKQACERRNELGSQLEGQDRCPTKDYFAGETAWHQCGKINVDCDRIASDMRLEAPEVDPCDGKWAFVDECPDCGGDTQSIVHWDGVWARYTPLPTAKCEDEAIRDGAPDSIRAPVYWTC